MDTTGLTLKLNDILRTSTDIDGGYIVSNGGTFQSQDKAEHNVKLNVRFPYIDNYTKFNLLLDKLGKFEYLTTSKVEQNNKIYLSLIFSVKTEQSFKAVDEYVTQLLIEIKKDKAQ